MAPEAEQEKDDVGQQYEDAHKQWASVVESARRKPKKPAPKLSGKKPEYGVSSTANAAAVASRSEDYKKPQSESREKPRGPRKPLSLNKLSAIVNGHDTRRIVSAPVVNQETEASSANFRYAWDPQEESKHSATPDRIELANIEKFVVRARRDLPELNGSRYVSTEDAVLRIIEQYREMSARMRDSKGQLESVKDLKTCLFNAEEERAFAQTKLQLLSQEFEELNTRQKNEADHLHRLVEQLRYDNVEQVSAHNTKLQMEQASQQEKVTEITMAYERQLMKARDDAAAQAQLIAGLESRLQEHRVQRNTFDGGIKEARATLEQHWRAQRQEHMNRTRKAEEVATARLHRERAKYEDVIKTLEMRIETERYEHETRLKKSEEMYEQRLHQEKAKHEELTKSLIVRLKRQFQEELASQKSEREEHKRVLDEKFREDTSQQQSLIKKVERSMHEVQTERARLTHQLKETESRLRQERVTHQKEMGKYEDILRRMRLQHKMESERQRVDVETRFKKMQQRYSKTTNEPTPTLPSAVEPGKGIEQERLPSHLTLTPLEAYVSDPEVGSSAQLYTTTSSTNAELGRKHMQNTEQKTSLSSAETHNSEGPPQPQLSYTTQSPDSSLRPKDRPREQDCPPIPPTPSNSKPLKPHHITGRFRRISDAIDQLSRLEWDFSKRATWPLSEENMRLLHPSNTRKLKQYIVRSSSWAFLCENIFIEPAAEASGSYKTGSLDGFIDMIKKVSTPPPPDLTTLIQLSSKTWAECCAQSYKVAVRPAPSDGNVLGREQSEVPILRLLVAPEIVRVGENGEEEEKITGWEGGVDVFTTAEKQGGVGYLARGEGFMR
jgi:hypothetical protein